jgi:hypothetical protein
MDVAELLADDLRRAGQAAVVRGLLARHAS